MAGENLVITALKKSGAGVALRLFDVTGTAVSTSVHFPGKERAFRAANMLERVSPYEISTVKLAIHDWKLSFRE